MSSSIFLPADNSDQQLTKPSLSVTQLTLELEPSFHPFVRLPAELRLKIWSHAHPGPRELRISCQKIRLWPSMPKLYAESFKTDLPLPQTCHICPESRDEALQIYKPLFRTTRSKCQILVCFEQDTIVMADKDLAYLGSQERKGIQKLKINVVDCVNFGRYHIQTIKDLEALREVEIVMDELALIREVNMNGRDIPSLLQLEFGDEMRDDPTWEWPRIRIVGSDTRKLLGTLRGGAWMRGWTLGDSDPSGQIAEAYWLFQTESTDGVV